MRGRTRAGTQSSHPPPRPWGRQGRPGAQIPTSGSKPPPCCGSFCTAQLGSVGTRRKPRGSPCPVATPTLQPSEPLRLPPQPPSVPGTPPSRGLRWGLPPAYARPGPRRRGIFGVLRAVSLWSAPSIGPVLTKEGGKVRKRTAALPGRWSRMGARSCLCVWWGRGCVQPHALLTQD